MTIRQYRIINLVLKDEYNVITFSDSERLQKNDFQPPDLFLIDKKLPGVDGLELCRLFKSQEHTKHIPVIMISASPNFGKSAKAAGADDFIEKPFSIKQLRAMIAVYMSN